MEDALLGCLPRLDHHARNLQNESPSPHPGTKHLVAPTRPAPFQRVCEQPAETQAPITDALVADHHATGSQDRLHATQAEAEAVLQPRRVLDHLGREAETAVGVGACHPE